MRSPWDSGTKACVGLGGGRCAGPGAAQQQLLLGGGATESPSLGVPRK